MATRNGEKSYATGYNAIQLSNNAEKTYPKLENNSQPPQTPDSTDVVITNNVDVEDDTPRLFNLYRNRKLLSHGLMDVALFSANANQLRYVLEGSDGNAISVICVALLLISILLQILVGVALLLSARYNVTNCDQRAMAFKLGNYVMVGIFLITIVNIFITSFGGPSSPVTILANPVTDKPDIS